MNETKSNEHHGMLFGCSCCAGGIHQRKAIRQWSRRGFLSTGIAGALATTMALPQRARAQSTLSPDAALQALLDGNKRFAEKRLTSFNEDLAILQQNTVAKQEPFAGVLACADSRVPVELVFDQTIGHLFVARVAGVVVLPSVYRDYAGNFQPAPELMGFTLVESTVCRNPCGLRGWAECRS